VYATSRRPLPKRPPPGFWPAIGRYAALIGFAAIAFTSVALVAGPGGTRVLQIGAPAVAGYLAWLTLAVAIVVALPLTMLRRMPLPVLGVLLANAVLVGLALREVDIPLAQLLAVDIALAYIAATRPRRISIAAAVTALGVLAFYWAAVGQLHRAFGASTEAAVALTIVVAWMIGNSIQQRRDYAVGLREQAAAEAVTAERLRIARELHDMVAHSIGIIAIQAGVGSRVIQTQPLEARNALRAIEATSRETLSGLRRMLGALRTADSDPVPLDPAPGLADVGRLAAMTADAGVSVDVQWRGQQRLLPADIDLSAFRIIQEAVTNVVRHAGSQQCRVSVDYRAEELSIQVLDDGGGCGQAGPGYGIVGMRERVSLLHGQFSAGPRPEGGFRVTARLPVPATAR
jgi:signal transduction histidine kinase